MKPLLISTKSLGRKHKTVLKHHFTYIEVPCLSFAPLTFDKNLLKENKENNLIFSSARAVRFFMESIKQNELDFDRCYCVGARTASIAKKFGLYVENTYLTARDLSDSMKNKKNKNLFFICGNKRLNTIPKTLQQFNINYTEICVYETKLRYPKIDLMPDILLFFSPSGVLSYSKHNPIYEQTQLFALGETTQEAILKYLNRKALIPNYPTIDLLIIKTTETLGL